MTTLDKQADLAGPGIGDYTELAAVLPPDYRSRRSRRRRRCRPSTRPSASSRTASAAS